MGNYVEEAKKYFSSVPDKHGALTEAHRGQVHAVGWNLTGQRLASASADSTAMLYTLKGKLVKDHELTGHTKPVDTMAWNPSHPDLMATVSSDRTMRIWDTRLSGKKSAHVIQTKGEGINTCWRGDGKTIAVGTKADHISFIDIRTNEAFLTKEFDCEINEIRWDSTGDKFYLTTGPTTHGEGCVLILNYPTLDNAHGPVSAHTANCICLQFDPAGKYYATGSADTLVGLWSVDEQACVRTFGNFEYPIRNLSFSHDGKMLAGASEDSYLNIIHVDTGEVLHSIDANDGTFSVAWHPKKVLLAFAGDEKGSRNSGSVRLFGQP
eukprot:m.20708 g.20708  ORF g.20708 m.20708 type:complete len:323 (+) comp6926_c0_seq1:203-1171(+)